MVSPPRGSALVEALVAIVIAAVAALPVVAAATRAVAAVDAGVDRRHGLHALQTGASAALATGCDPRGAAAPVRTDSADTPAGRVVRRRHTTVATEVVEVRLVAPRGVSEPLVASVPCH